MPIDLVTQLAGAAIRACGLCLIAFVGLFLFRVRSSAARHAIWTVVLAGMLLQIPLGMVAPAVQWKVLPASIQQQIVERAPLSIPAAPTPRPARPTAAAPGRRSVRSGAVTLSGIFAGIYLAISMLLFVRMALGSWGLRRILRDSKPVPTLGPGIFESALLAVPGSVGCFRARILLPQAWSGWDPLKLRAVLAHERSHVRRGDWLIRVVSRVNVCIFWFHPLSWWMERELARLAEDACDDAAVAGMDDREDYVATLVEIAQVAAADGAVLNWRVISMARDSNVIRRVNRILQARAPLPKPFGRLAWVTLLACSLPVIYLSAAVKLASAVAAGPVAAAPQRVFPVRKSSARLIAQASPNQPLRPIPPPAVLTPDEASITLCILIDSSGSMWGKRPAVEAAALALVAALKPRDKVCIVDFDDEVLSALAHGEDFTSDVTEMKEALTHIEARGGKAMRDAVRMSIDRMEQAAPASRKVLVLITEGYDSSSTVSQEQLLARVRSSGVPVYCIGLVNGDGLVRAGAARLALRQLAEASGGRVYYPDDLAQVESISPAIAAAVRK